MSSPGQENQPQIIKDRSCPAGIYIHIPFCRQKCLYCDFISGTDLSPIDEYVTALCDEIGLRQNPNMEVDSIYFGGGTPTLLAPDQTNQILATIRSAFIIDPNVEITIEANPETVNFEALKQFVALGINRISIGVQSFQTYFLKLLGRGHDDKRAMAALEVAHRAAFDQIGLDLIYGIPSQTVNLLTRDLQTALQFSPDHLSCYSLTVAPGTPFEKLCQKEIIKPLGDSKTALLFEETDAFLTGHGYEHYEISNFARPDCRSRHNQKYWQGIPYLGFGAAAHSYLPPVRSWNDPSVGRYITTLRENRLPTLDSETLTPKEQAIETIMLGLRTDQGVELSFLNGLTWGAHRNTKNKMIQDWIHDGKARINQHRLVLTVGGMLVADALTGELLNLINNV